MPIKIIQKHKFGNHQKEGTRISTSTRNVRYHFHEPRFGWPLL